MKRRVAIVGGGISGLTAAWVLAREHSDTCEVTLFEASSRLGGIIETVRAGGFTIECGPDSWVTEKPWAAELAAELGLGGDLIPSNDHERRTWIAQEGRLIPLPDGMRMMVPTDLSAIAASPLFSDAAKDAYRDEPARAGELRTSALLARGGDESVAAFVERHFGAEVVRTVAGPLLAGIFGGDIRRLSARALLTPFVAMEAQQGSLIRALQQRPASTAPIFTTLDSGLDTIVDRMAERLIQTRICHSTPVHRLLHDRDAWTVESAAGSQQFDRVILAASLNTTRALLASLSLSAAQQAAGLLPSTAASGLVVAFGYAAGAMEPSALPSGFGLLVASPSEARSLLACTFLHQKFPNRAPQGAVLLRAFFSSTAADELSTAADEHIAHTAREQLAALLGPLPSHADVTIVRRWPHSLPQYEVGHIERIAQFHQHVASMPGLAVIGNAIRGVGLPDLVRSATEAAHDAAQR